VRRTERLEASQRALDRHLDADQVLEAAQTKDARATLEAALVAAAVESASLAWERRRYTAHDRQHGRICSRRIGALVEVAKLRLALHRLEPGAPEPGAVERVTDHLRRAVEQAARDVLPPQDADRFVVALGSRWKLPEWAMAPVGHGL